MSLVRVRDMQLPGPAVSEPSALAGVSATSPNRLGSLSVPLRCYESSAETAWGTLVWAHGGSFVRGTLDWPEADWVAQRFAEGGLRVYSVDYVLASETVKAPAPANDVAAVLRHVLHMHEAPVFVGGASAGGQLAAAAALHIAEDPRGDAAGTAAQPLRALLLVYPTLHRVQLPNPEIAALVAGLPEQRRFRADRIAEMYEYYLGFAQQEPSRGLVVGELAAERLAVLPPTVIVSAEADELRASAEQFAGQLRAAGVKVSAFVQPGTVHGYLNRPAESRQAEESARATVATLLEWLRGSYLLS